MRNCQRPVRPSSERERLGRECDPRQRSHPGQRPVRAPCQIHRGTGRPVRRRTARKPLYSRRSTGSFFASRRPADYRRAPLRPDQVDRAAHGNRLVTPPITRGLHCGSVLYGISYWSVPVTRRLPAGSITVATTLPALWRWPRHPADYRRAPLRRVPGGDLRPHPRRYPADYRRAPLRHRDRSRIAATSCSSPADYWRAPFRPRGRRGRPQPRHQVTPPITGGLHCGHMIPLPAKVAAFRSPRRLLAGSIAASWGCSCPSAPG
jgi:hypothetical protein